MSILVPWSLTCARIRLILSYSSIALVARPGQFLGSNTALFPGQALGDLHCSSYFAPAPVGNLNLPGRYIRLRSECTNLGFTFFSLEGCQFGPGIAGAVWDFLPQGLQTGYLRVISTGSFLNPMVSLAIHMFLKYSANVRTLSQAAFQVNVIIRVANGQIAYGYEVP